MISLGFAGTAKNTGKTTTALHVLEQCQRAGMHVGLTSIGYDGENTDTVTGLPKPRYLLTSGSVFATAEGCLRAGTAGYRILRALPVHTILGSIMVAEVARPGTVVLAGPNRRSDLSLVLDEFRQRELGLAMIDGALNRIVPLSGADGLVLATGAAFDPNIETVARHAGAASELFALPASKEWDESNKKIQIACEGCEIVTLPTGSLFSRETLESIAASLTGKPARLLIPGACSPALLECLIKEHSNRLDGAKFTLGGPLRMIAAGDPRRWLQIIACMQKNGQTMDVIGAVPLRLVTVNPFYPRYLSAGRYQPAEVDKVALLNAVRAAVSGARVANIREEPVELQELLL